MTHIERLEHKIKTLEAHVEVYIDRCASRQKELDKCRKHIELMKQENQRLRTEVLGWRTK